MQHQSPEYDSVPVKSTQLVSRFKWRVMMATLVATIVGGLGLAVVLANGAANPPRASHLVVDLESLEGLEAATPNLTWISTSTLRDLSSAVYPITIEVMVEVENTSKLWGIVVATIDTPTPFRLLNSGYFSVEPVHGWQEFMHIHPRENKLYLHVDTDGTGIFRINGEIAWTGRLTSDLLSWGVIYPADSPISWHYIRLYTG